MPVTDRRYCILGLHFADDADNPQILCINGQVVLFDTLSMAQEFIPRLSGGRLQYWDATQEIIAFSPLLRDGFNRVSIFTGYDPFDVPNGFRGKGVWSEAEGRDWKYHVIWNEVLRELIIWADQQVVDADPFHLVPELIAA